MQDSFCSDIVALFFNHIWECDVCLPRILIFIVISFFACCLFWILINFFADLGEKLLDRLAYKKKYIELQSDYEDLFSDYVQLEKEYYHTCN